VDGGRSPDEAWLGLDLVVCSRQIGSCHDQSELYSFLGAARRLLRDNLATCQARAGVRNASRGYHRGTSTRSRIEANNPVCKCLTPCARH